MLTRNQLKRLINWDHYVDEITYFYDSEKSSWIPNHLINYDIIIGYSWIDLRYQASPDLDTDQQFGLIEKFIALDQL